MCAASLATIAPVRAAGAVRAPLPLAAALPPDARAQLDRLVDAAAAAGEFPGAQLVIASSHGILYRKAYGVESSAPAVANRTSAIYEWASVTKAAITATAVMMLVERGVLRTSDKVARWIPEFAANGKADVTIAQLLTHTSGMPQSFERADYQADRPTIMRHAYAAALRFAPGSKFEYSNLGFITLAEVIARASGMPYEQFVERNLFAPLGMRDSSFDVTIDAAHRARLVPQLREQTVQTLRDRFGTVPGVNGHAGLLSTADDVATLAVAYLRAARGVETPGFLAPQTVRAMVTPRYVGDGQVRGLGWDLDSAFSRNRGEIFARGGFGHTGSSGTSIWIDPASDLAIVFASNAHYPDDKGASTVPLESALATVVAAHTRYASNGADVVTAERAQETQFDAEAARSALSFPATPGPAPTPQPGR